LRVTELLNNIAVVGFDLMRGGDDVQPRGRH
jgi:hypothetical protein